MHFHGGPFGNDKRWRLKKLEACKRSRWWTCFRLEEEKERRNKLLKIHQNAFLNNLKVLYFGVHFQVIFMCSLVLSSQQVRMSKTGFTCNLWLVWFSIWWRVLRCFTLIVFCTFCLLWIFISYSTNLYVFFILLKLIIVVCNFFNQLLYSLAFPSDLH